MQVHIVGQGFTLTDAIRAHVDRRMRFALGRFSGRVARVRIVLGNQSVSTGALNKICTVRVGLSGLPEILVEQIDSDIYAAIDRAADRVGRTVARRLDRALEVARGLASPEPPTEEP